MPQPSEWYDIPDFAGHEISQYGEVRNKSNGRIMKMSTNQYNVSYVSMRNTTTRQYETRAVSTLMADTFAQGKGVITLYGGINDTVMHLDGDLSNNAASNLVWVPRWYAIAFHNQMNDPNWHNKKRIEEVESHRLYRSYAHAASETGALPNAIQYATQYNDGMSKDSDSTGLVHRVIGGYIFRSI